MTLTHLRPRHQRASLLAACAWSVATLAGAAATFDDLGVLPGGGRSPEALAVSADGTTVIGRYVIDGVGHRGFRWTAATGVQDLGTLPGAPTFSTVSPRGVSADGSVIVGAATAEGGPTHAFRWTAAGMESFGEPLPGGLVWAATGVSADGSVVVGSVIIYANGTPRAARWSSSGSLEVLGTDEESYNSNSRGVSADGGTIVGVRSEGLPFRWAEGRATMLPRLRPNDIADAWAVSADGSVVAGTSGGRAFRWTLAGGSADLGDVSGGSGASALAINADGSAIAGEGARQNSPVAMLWRPDMGMVDLAVHLTALGADVTGWILGTAFGISADGTTIVGHGLSSASGQWEPRAWIARGLPAAATCTPVTLQVQPQGAAACPDGAAAFAVTSNGSLPLSAQWERETAPGTGAFVALGDGPTNAWDGQAPGSGATVSGAATHQLTIAADTASGSVLTPAHAIRYRYVVSNACGTATSVAALLTLGPDADGDGQGDPCDDDDDGDGVLDTQDPCPLVAGEPPGDADADGVGDTCDDCRVIWDPSQADADANGEADACEIPWADVAPRHAPDGRVSVADIVMLRRMASGFVAPDALERSRGDIAPATSGGDPSVLTPDAVPPRFIDSADTALATEVLIGRAILAGP